MTKNVKIVITGASGFVATHLRNYLSKQNVELISISRNNFRKFKNESRFISKNYNEEGFLKKIKNADALIHLVGIGKQSTKLDYNAVNVEFTKHVVNLCKKAKIPKFVYMSGLGVSSDTSLGYFISKYKAEKIIINSGLNYTIFRPSYIVGKDDPFTKYLKKQIKTGRIIIPGSGFYSIQPIYINDVAEIIFQSITKKIFQNKILDLVGPEYITFEQYTKLFSKKAKVSIKKINLEEAYFNAINNSKSDFGVDDLNILVGNFQGNHKKLKQISKLEFSSILEILESGRLL